MQWGLLCLWQYPISVVLQGFLGNPFGLLGRIEPFHFFEELRQVVIYQKKFLVGCFEEAFVDHGLNECNEGIIEAVEV